MAWSMKGPTGGRTLTAIETSRKMRTPINVLGASLDYHCFQAFIRDTLMLRDNDLVSAEAVSERMMAVLAHPVELPVQVAKSLAGLIMPSTTFELAQFHGVDPLRLVLDAFFCKAGLRNGIMEMDAAVERASSRDADQRPKLRMSLTLAPGIKWSGDQLVARRTAMPETVVMAMKGRTLNAIVDHPWQGWERLRIASAQRSGNTLIVRTDNVVQCALVADLA